MKVCSNDRGLVTKMAKVCSNDNPWLTLTYFTARSALLPNAFIWENAYILNFIETVEVDMYELKVGTSS